MTRTRAPGPASSGAELRKDRDEECVRAVSIILPAFNEGAHIRGQITAILTIMDDSEWEYETLVVDDGSSDETSRNASVKGVKVLRHSQNRGYGAALKRGIAEAQFDWILIVDADGTYPSSALARLLERAPGQEMVVGARIGKETKIPIMRRPAKWFLSHLASYLSGRELPDINSGLRLMRKDLVETYLHLLPSGFSFTTTITVAAACNDHPITYVPIDYYARLGKSKIRPWHAYDLVLAILRTVMFFNPLKVFFPIGLVIACLGLAKLAYDITIGNISEGALLGLLGALIVWAVGLLADQNARIHNLRLKSQRG